MSDIMKIYDLCIKDVKVIEPDIHRDHRGFLSIPISIKKLKENGIFFNIVQINQGYSIKPYTIRGMHFQSDPWAQAKLISANYGSFFSVAVDIRKGSPTFGHWCGEEISFKNQRVMFVPRGFAHGYLTLEEDTVLQYCVDNEYCLESARSLKHNDPKIGIEWPYEVDTSTLTEKDSNGLSLDNLILNYQ